VTSALITGLVLCLTGLIIVLFTLFLVPLIANQLCDLQPTVGLLPPLDDLLGEECTEVFTAGFLAIFSVPGTLLLLIGSFVVVMATTNRRIAYRRSGYRIKNDGLGPESS
jgi:hypothetical protein